jgi:hypothetical protein
MCTEHAGEMVRDRALSDVLTEVVAGGSGGVLAECGVPPEAFAKLYAAVAATAAPDSDDEDEGTCVRASLQRERRPETTTTRIVLVSSKTMYGLSSEIAALPGTFPTGCAFPFPSRASSSVPHHGICLNLFSLPMSITCRTPLGQTLTTPEHQVSCL